MLVSEETKLTITLDAQLHDAFITEAVAQGNTASQVIAVLIRKYIEGRQSARDREVEEGRASMRAGIGIPNEQVEAESAEWCAAILRKA